MMKTRIDYDRNTNEYCVRVWINGKRDSHKDYFTDYKPDAIGTEKVMHEQYNASKAVNA